MARVYTYQVSLANAQQAGIPQQKSSARSADVKNVTSAISGDETPGASGSKISKDEQEASTALQQLGGREGDHAQEGIKADSAALAAVEHASRNPANGVSTALDVEMLKQLMEQYGTHGQSAAELLKATSSLGSSLSQKDLINLFLTQQGGVQDPSQLEPKSKRQKTGNSHVSSDISLATGLTSNEHMPLHTGSPLDGNNQVFPCPHPSCNKTFSRLYNLKSHAKTHTDDKPFKCEHCGATFARNHDLKRHSHIHDTGGRVHRCEGCGRTFSRLDALKRHQSNKRIRSGCYQKFHA